MKPEKKRASGPGALELIEEAVHLLRLAPTGILATYYLGSLPFVLCFLYFWADMSRSAYAEKHCAVSALGLAFAFIWMKTWQSVFARQVRAYVARETPPEWPLSRWLRVASQQTLLHATGVFIVPAALVLTLPFGWVYAFYQNLTVLGDGETKELKKLWPRAARQCFLWPKQNHALLAILSLFGLFVALNAAIGAAEIPALLKMLFGWENAFTRSSHSLLNTTFLAAIGWLTYLCVDPILKAVYVLRCFYGESLHTGDDLKAELKSLTAGRFATLALALLLFSHHTGRAETNQTEVVPAHAASHSHPATPKVSAANLDQQINQVIHQREYDWRLPREKLEVDDRHKGPFDKFMDSLVERVKGWFSGILVMARDLARSIRDFLQWVWDKLGRNKTGPSESPDNGEKWITSLQALLLILLAAVVSALVILIFRAWKQRRFRRDEIATQPVQPVPDLNDENVAADQLPEDGWLKLAGELMAQGDLRLALRAFYLASLAHLAQREIIQLARFKSNRDYERELRRRARALPELQAAFTENVALFDCVWYGAHPVTETALQNFKSNVERIKAC